VVVLGLPLALTLIAIVTISVLDRTNGSIVTSGDTREYLLHVPNSYERAKPTPLVISMHAGATWPAQQRNLSRWNRLADANGFIVVYPSGTPQLLGVARVWHSFATGPGVERDVRFISELIDTLQSAYNIDPADLRQRHVQWRGDGVRAGLHHVGSDRSRGHGGPGAIAPASLVCEHAARADDGVSRFR